MNLKALLYALLVWTALGLTGHSQTLAVNFNTDGELSANFKKTTGTMPTQATGYITAASGTTSIWYTTDPDGTSTAKPYDIPANSVFSYSGGSLKVSMDFLASSGTTGKLTVPGIYVFNPTYTGVNSGVIATFSSNNDSASSADSLALRYVNDPIASSLGTSLASTNPSNGVLNWGANNAQWLRLELVVTQVTATSVRFTTNLYSIAAAESPTETLIGTTSSSAIDFGTTSTTVDFASNTSLAIGIRDYIDGGASLAIDHFTVTVVPEPGTSALMYIGLLLLLGSKRLTRGLKI